MLSVLTICAYGFASFQNPGGASGPCPMASVPSSSNDCVECPAGKTNYAAGETTCTYAFSTAAAPDYYQDGLNLVEAKGNIQARFRLFRTPTHSRVMPPARRRSIGQPTVPARDCQCPWTEQRIRHSDGSWKWTLQTRWTTRPRRLSRRLSSTVQRMRLVCLQAPTAPW